MPNRNLGYLQRVSIGLALSLNRVMLWSPEGATKMMVHTHSKNHTFAGLAGRTKRLMLRKEMEV